MRLDKIHVAGFKSFVDATTIQIPGDLVGIVGPNGCAKSNVIDAVRWVMGESSARNLRGDNMADVIFNGSVSRKPVGKASVELIFDNAQGKAPDSYPVLLPGEEHKLQQKLDLWNRFQLAHGFFPTLARLLVAGAVVGGTVFVGFSF